MKEPLSPDELRAHLDEEIVQAEQSVEFWREQVRLLNSTPFDMTVVQALSAQKDHLAELRKARMFLDHA